MALTFKDILASDGANVFCNASEFGVAVVHTSPDGTVETVTGLLDADVLDAGQSPVVNDKGARVKQRAVLELPVSVFVVEEQPGGAYPSKFLISGQVWLAVRVIGKDDATQAIEIKRADQKATKRP